MAFKADDLSGRVTYRPGPDGAPFRVGSLDAMPREIPRRRAVVIAVVMAALSVVVWARAGDGGPDVPGDSTAITSGPAGFDQAVARVKTDSAVTWGVFNRSSRAAFAGALAMLVSLVVTGLGGAGHARVQLVAATPLLARRYSLVVRGPPSSQLS